MGDEEERHHSLVPKVSEKLVELGVEELLFGHRIQVPIQAIDDHDLRISLFNRLSDRVHQFARREFRGVDLLQRHSARRHL